MWCGGGGFLVEFVRSGGVVESAPTCWDPTKFLAKPTLGGHGNSQLGAPRKRVPSCCDEKHAIGLVLGFRRFSRFGLFCKLHRSSDSKTNHEIEASCRLVDGKNTKTSCANSAPHPSTPHLVERCRRSSMSQRRWTRLLLTRLAAGSQSDRGMDLADLESDRQ